MHLFSLRSLQMERPRLITPCYSLELSQEFRDNFIQDFSFNLQKRQQPIKKLRAIPDEPSMAGQTSLNAH
jgi:hypothetical protein